MRASFKYDETIIKAMNIAVRVHRNQYIKNSDVPFIAHIIEAGIILMESNIREEIVVSGLLYDVLGKTEYSEIDIKLDFGERILELVQGVSQILLGGEFTNWVERKKNTIKLLEDAPKEIKQIICGIELATIRRMIREYEEIGHELWDKLDDADIKMYEWYYESLVKGLSELDGYQSYNHLKEAVEALFNISISIQLQEELQTLLNIDNSRIATRKKIKEWVVNGLRMGASHCLIIYDTLDHEYYNKYIYSKEELKEVIDLFNKPGALLERIMEIYDLRKDIDEQLESDESVWNV